MTRSNPSASRKTAGFTLAELAIVLVIVGLLLSSLMPPLSAQIDQRHVNETNQVLQQVKDALAVYAITRPSGANPYLPCPAADDTGVEATRVGGACPSDEGRLPWQTLGLGNVDAWSNRFRYKVDGNFSNSTTGFTLTTTGTLQVCEDAACAKVLANALPAVIVSHGKNGAGAFNASGTVNNAPDAGNTDELENTDGDSIFVSHTPTASFDDVVAWLPPALLLSRMVTTGRLP